MATSPLPSQGPKRGRKCYVTHAVWGSPTPSAGGNSEVATSPLHSRGPRRGQKCYVTSAFSRVPSREKFRSGYLTPAFSGAHRMAEVLHNPCILGVPNAKRGSTFRSGYLTPTFSGAKKRAEVLRNPCIPGGPQRQAWGEIHMWLPHPRNPCILGGSPTPSTGKNSEVATSPLPSQGPTRGRKCYATPAFSGSPTPSMGRKSGVAH